MNDLEEIKKELAQVKERNKRVENDKAWETSLFRIISISIATYITVVIALYIIGANNIFLAAIIPVIGFIFSTLSLPPLKKWWIEKR